MSMSLGLPLMHTVNTHDHNLMTKALSHLTAQLKGLGKRA